MPRSRAWWRILDTPTHTAIPGTCTRCGGRAWHGQYRWWHQTGCVDRRPGAEFVPD